MKSVRRLLGRYFLSPRNAVIAIALVLVVAAADLAMPWLVKLAVDALVAGRGGEAGGIFRQVLFLSALIAGACLLQYICRYVLSRLYNRVVYRGAARLREELYGLLQRQPLNSLAERRIGEVLTHLVTDVQVLQDSCLDLISEIPFDVCVLGGLGVAMILLNPFLASMILAFLALSIGAAFVMGRRGFQVRQEAMRSTADLTSRIQEGLSSVRTLALFDSEGGDGARLRGASSQHADDLERAGKVQAAVTPFLGLAEYMGIVIVLLAGGWSMLYGTLTAGGLVAFLAYMEMSADPMARSAHILPGLQKGWTAAARLSGLLEKLEAAPEKSGTLRPSRVRGDVDFKNVSFRYAGRQRPALKDLQFSVKAGEKVAVVGRNGSGKSTLLDLLLRLQRPESGKIRLDKRNIDEIALDFWRILFGVVPQDTRLLNRSLAENIAPSSASEPSILAAAESAGLDGWVRRLSKGYETVLGEGGAFLSGGERQSVALARLFHRNPCLLILDEPTSALDARSEKDLLPVLRKICRGRTCFVVSHRAEVLADADKVLLLDEGRQLAFDVPSEVWRKFPDFRALFPVSWSEDRVRPPDEDIPTLPSRSL